MQEVIYEVLENYLSYWLEINVKAEKELREKIADEMQTLKNALRLPSGIKKTTAENKFDGG